MQFKLSLFALVLPLFFQVKMPSRFVARWVKQDAAAATDCRIPVSYSATDLRIGKADYKTIGQSIGSDTAFFTFGEGTFTITKVNDAHGNSFFHAVYYGAKNKFEYLLEPIKQ